MIRFVSGTVLALSIVAFGSAADAKGCIKGAIVGGIAGHYAGHHGLMGAAAGCAIGRHRASAAARRNDQMPAASR